MTTLSKKDVDFGRTSKDYAKHRAGFPDRFFAEIKKRDWMSDVQTLLDIGTGTGTLARGFAKEGLTVTGLDPAENQISAARGLDAAAGINIEYVVSGAESIPLPDAAFDMVTAGQCWHWFEPAKVVAELRRVLKPKGKVIIAYFDWMHRDGNPVDVMTQLREKYNPGWKGEFPLGFYPQGPGDLILDGFMAADSFLYHENIPYTHEGWRGRMRAYAGIGGSLPQDKVDAFDVEFAGVLQKHFPEDVMQVEHKIWAQIFERSAISAD